MRRHFAFAFLTLVCVPAVSGCGPLMSTYLIIAAQAELDGAEAAEAEKYAVYEYTAASEYIAKAREEQGYADFGPSIDYAFKAQELAVKAKDRAERERDKARGPGGMSVDEPASASPADYEEPSQPKVIIKKAPSASSSEGSAPVGVQIVPISPEQPE